MDSFFVLDTSVNQGGIILVLDGEISQHWCISSLERKQWYDILCAFDVPLVAEAILGFSKGAKASEAKGAVRERIEHILETCEKQITWIQPKAWQKFLGFNREGRSDYQWKKYLMEQAKFYFPDHKINKENADAFLITKYILDGGHTSRPKKTSRGV